MIGIAAIANPTCRAALTTPTGRGAIATILVSGHDTLAAVSPFFTPASGKEVAQCPFGKILFGRWSHGNGPAEELVICRRSAEEIEIHCHGGLAAAETIMKGLKSRGCDEVPWMELVPRFSPDPLAAAARIALADARTERTAAILLDQYHGALRNALEHVRTLFDRQEWVAASAALQALERYASVGLHLTTPWRVVLVGPPNVGKSSLINAILGYERSIVFDQPGTTRDVVTATAVLDGWLVQLSDTAGLREATDAIEAIGVARAESALAAADLVVFVLDAREFDMRAATAIEHSVLAKSGARPILVLNKCDLAINAKYETPKSAAFSAIVPTSAVCREGIDTLINTIVQRLVPFAPPPGAAVPFLPEHQQTIQNLISRVSVPLLARKQCEVQARVTLDFEL